MSIIYSLTDDSLHVVPEVLEPNSVSSDRTSAVIMTVEGVVDPSNPPIEIKLWSNGGMFASTAKILGRSLLSSK